MNKISVARILPYLTVPLAILSILTYLVFSLGNTFIVWAIQAFILFVFFSANVHFFDTQNKRAMLFVKIYLIWNIFSILRGVIIAGDYWDYRALTNQTMTLLLPIVAYASTNEEIVKALLKKYFYIALPLFFVTIFFLRTVAYGFYLVPVSFMLLFLPLLEKKWKFIIIGITLLVLLVDLGARSNVIKFAFPLFFVLLLYTGITKKRWLMELTRLLFMFLPFILFVLAITNVFNVFKMDEYIEAEYTKERVDETGRVRQERLTADTRTFLYTEVILSAKLYNSWWIGRSPAKGNKTEAFGDWAEENYGKRERYSNEVAILNIFTWTGIVGVIFYFLVFWRASYLAIHRSRNDYIKIIGIFVAFRSFYAWVEDINTFNLNYFFLWVLIGLCLSVSFRNMTNDEVKNWVRGIFNKPVLIRRTLVTSSKIEDV